MAATAEHPLVDVRADFPVLGRVFDGRRVAYLDSAATPQRAASGGRGDGRVPAPLVRADPPRRLRAGARGDGRLRVRSDPDRRVRRLGPCLLDLHTHNATEAINLVAYSWGRANVGAGDEVLITEMEHHSNIVPWQMLCEETGARLRYLTLTEGAELSLEELDLMLAEGRVKLVAFAHVSNVLGTINPVAEIVRRARAAGAVTVVDGAQAVLRRCRSTWASSTRTSTPGRATRRFRADDRDAARPP